jgi:hypothetical protein
MVMYLTPAALARSTQARASNLVGVEGGGEPFVFGHGDLAILHHPLALAEKAVDAPVNEQAELRVLEPLTGGETIR